MLLLVTTRYGRVTGLVPRPPTRPGNEARNSTCINVQVQVPELVGSSDTFEQRVMAQAQSSNNIHTVLDNSELRSSAHSYWTNLNYGG